jgi:hypothetical protein
MSEHPTAGPADLPADAMRTLFDRALAAAAAGQREHVEAWLTDLLDLATGNLSDDARGEVIRQALGQEEPPVDAKRAWEVSLGSRIVTARSAREAALIARAEWHAEAGGKYYEADPNERYWVRPAYSRARRELVYPDKPPRAARP